MFLNPKYSVLLSQCKIKRSIQNFPYIAVDVYVKILLIQNDDSLKNIGFVQQIKKVCLKPVWILSWSRRLNPPTCAFSIWAKYILARTLNNKRRARVFSFKCNFYSFIFITIPWIANRSNTKKKQYLFKICKGYENRTYGNLIRCSLIQILGHLLYPKESCLINVYWIWI